MSARGLRRLQQQQLAPALPVGSEATDDDEDASEGDAHPPVTAPRGKGGKKKAAVNPFDLLGMSEDGGEGGGNVGDSAEESDGDGEGAVEGSAGGAKGASGNAKRKKKKKKSKANAKGKGRAADDGAEDAGAAVGEEDEIDRTLRELNITPQPRPAPNEGTGRSANASSDSRPLLSIDAKFLSGEAEMRRIFGSRVVNEAGSSGGRRGAHAAPRKAKSWFPSPKSTWPRTGRPGISMEYLGARGRDLLFELRHSVGYQEAQGRFLDAVDTLDPSAIAAVLNIHPYHVDALLQLSEICKMSGDPQLACDLIERALWAVETGFHAMFNLALGTCRLAYRRRENRGLFLALFRYAQFMAQRGCWRTALEYARVLLALDPDDDPLCALLLVDYFALRAGEHGFLCRLHSEWDAHRDLSLLPNFAYSVPLARFHQGDVEAADAMLQRAILSFPGVIPLLVPKCGVSWASADAPYFLEAASASTSSHQSLRQLETLYVERAHSQWKEPEVLSWLQRNVAATLARVDKGDPLVKSSAQSRAVNYRGTPRNIHRHILISESIADLKDVLVTLPEEVTRSAILMHDPLPPTDSTSSYDPRANRAVPQPHNESTLLSFLRALLPSYTPDEQVAAFNDLNRQVERQLARNENNNGPIMDEMPNPLAGALRSLRQLLGGGGGARVDGNAEPVDSDPEVDEAMEFD